MIGKHWFGDVWIWYRISNYTYEVRCDNDKTVLGGGRWSWDGEHVSHWREE
jgi:hypothetical protein